MWTYERSAETTAPPEAVWACWSDLRTWPSWNAGIESITVDGPLAAGTRFTMTTPPDGEAITLRIVDVVAGRRFTDQADYGGVVVTTIHRLEPTAHGTTRVTYRTEITGPDADQAGPEIGPAITADFGDVLHALIRRAESGSSTPDSGTG
jgi:uncharacterized protein YndB with AHSA1/START domain